MSINKSSNNGSHNETTIVPLSFETLKFYKEEDGVKTIFLRNYQFFLKKEDLEKISEYSITKENTITFHNTTEKKARMRFMFLLNEGFNNLANIFTKKPTIYVHQNSTIPLMGTRFFGILDRGSTLLELKPITGCNAGCTFCSVDEGIGSKKTYDVVVEREYLINETKKLLEYKNNSKIHVYINVHGEPLLYYDIINLVKDLKAITYVKDITIISNGMLLTKQMIHELSSAGLTTLNISVSAMDPLLAKKIMGTEAYSIEKIKEMLIYAVQHAQFKTIITPVMMHGINEQEMDEIINFGKTIGCDVKIQKFCYNKAGRNPIKEITWELFYNDLAKLEKRSATKLKEEMYTLEQTKEYPCPFKRGEKITASIVCPGRYPLEKIAVAQGRCITIPVCHKNTGEVKLEILATQHNVIMGKVM